MTFIQKMDVLRRARGYSERSLAMELGIDPSAISRWRTRKSLPRPEIVKKLADIFGLAADALVDNSKPLPHEIVFAGLRSASDMAKLAYPNNPTAGQLAFEKMAGDHAAKQERANLADYLRERAKALREEATALEKKARQLES